jgi:hypothetical protein
LDLSRKNMQTNANKIDDDDDDDDDEKSNARMK